MNSRRLMSTIGLRPGAQPVGAMFSLNWMGFVFLSNASSCARSSFFSASGTDVRSGREFAAWLGLVPRQNSTGGKTRLGGITKRGIHYMAASMLFRQSAKRQALAAGLKPPNHKRVYRVMKVHGLLLDRHAGGVERRHDGRIAVDERNRRWCSDGFEIGWREAPPSLSCRYRRQLGIPWLSLRPLWRLLQPRTLSTDWSGSLRS
jgi:hypothetical protein